jgi:hypothetical protein
MVPLRTFRRHVAHQKRAAAIAVHPIHKTRNVQRDNVAVQERSCVGDTMTEHIIDRGTRRFRKSRIIERTGVGAVFHNVLVNKRIQFIRGDAGLHKRGDVGPRGTRQLTGSAHGSNLPLVLDFQRLAHAIRHLPRSVVRRVRDTEPFNSTNGHNSTAKVKASDR